LSFEVLINIGKIDTIFENTPARVGKSTFFHSLKNQNPPPFRGRGIYSVKS